MRGVNLRVRSALGQSQLVVEYILIREPTPRSVVLVTGRKTFATAGQGRRASAVHRAQRALARWYNQQIR
jgi:hypothetical protein